MIDYKDTICKFRLIPNSLTICITIFYVLLNTEEALKLLFVTARFPWPLDKGDKLRAYNQLKYLSRHHEIALFAISEQRINKDWIEALSPFCKKIKVIRLSRFRVLLNIVSGIFTSLPLQSIYYFNSQISEELKMFSFKERPGKIIFQLVRTTLYARMFNTKDCIIDLMDCMSYHYFLRYKNSSFFKQIFYYREYIRLKRYEIALLNRYPDILIISKKDKSLLPGIKKKVHVIGNGVEIHEIQKSTLKNVDVLFLGNLRYQPNIRAAKFIIAAILPLLKKADPNIRVCIAGIAANQLKTGQLKNLQLLENVEHTLPLFKSSQVFVAPMFLSTGIQNKILEAVVARIPVVTTPNAADAIGLINGVHVLTAISPQEFNDQIIHLLSNARLRTLLIENAYEFVQRHCNWEKNIKLMGNIINNSTRIMEAAES